MREAARWLEQRDYDYVCFVEQDHIPLISNWADRLLERRERERADVLFHCLCRVDGTTSPHYKYHLSDPAFATAWESLSRRDEKGTILNCIGTGSFWRRDAFIDVGNASLPTPVYLEMSMPTTAHHLGYRVRDFEEQNPFIAYGGAESPDELLAAQKRGGWSAHKVKDIGIFEAVVEKTAAPLESKTTP
jgi:hypothetical protein